MSNVILRQIRTLKYKMSQRVHSMQSNQRLKYLCNFETLANSMGNTQEQREATQGITVPVNLRVNFVQNSVNVFDVIVSTL